MLTNESSTVLRSAGDYGSGMTTDSWKWKGKDGSAGGLLYESGNWGDLLKMLWLSAILSWKRQFDAPTNYLDTFAGDTSYPVGRKTLFRIRRAAMPEFAFLETPFIATGRWPSSASAARLLTEGRIEVFDADFGRRQRWSAESEVAVPEAASGWDVLAGRDPDTDGVWLVDPYDFLSEWRQWLPMLLDKASQTTVLLYVYNRSAKNTEAFREYRAFRNALEDLRGDAPKRIGRIAADPFLPRSHHEMVFLPGAADRERESFDSLLATLASRTERIVSACEAASAYDC